jgi:UDP-N-acetylmuramoylalanine--D-glutamate ligase
VITNCTPNHLDWHGTQSHYAWSKQELLRRQPRAGLAVLNPHDPQVAGWSALAHGECLLPPPLASLPPLLVPGEHNRQNAACAAAAASGVGCSPSSIEQALMTFRGLPQRLELVGEVAGRRFYSDSQATTPESTISALKTIVGPSWLIAGGADKGSQFTQLARAVASYACGAVFYGSVRDPLARTVRIEAPDTQHAVVESLPEAFAWCWQRSRPGDAVLLSPACASLDQFRDWAHRGACFVELVRGLQ